MMAAALLSSAEPVHAQTTTTTETTRTMLTATLQGCTELVDVSFDETHKTESQTGTNFVRISDMFHDQGSGVGQGSGAPYQFSSTSTNTFRSSSPNFSVRILFRDHLIRQGASVPGTDLFALQTILINVTNGHATFKVQTPIPTECR
jgi:hypothetical protein